MLYPAAAVLAAILTLPSPRYAPGADPETSEARRDRLQVIAEAIVSASAHATCDALPKDCAAVWAGGAGELEALLVTQAWWESKFMFRVHANRCAADECDAHRVAGGGIEHRSRSLWQIQRSRAVQAVEWSGMAGTGAAATETAAYVASRLLGAARGLGARSGDDWVLRTLSAYATGRAEPWPGAGPRLTTYKRVLSVMQRR